MSSKKMIITSAIASVLALSVTPAIANAADTEKCYGISKKGANDCATAGHSCAGSAVKDNQGDAFILMPKGLCERIVGGSLSKIEEGNSKS